VPADLDIVLFTIAVCSLSTLVIIPPGVALAWVLARRDFPGKRLVETFLTLPLVLPPVATGLILLKILGRRGPLGRLLENTLGIEVAFTWRAVVIASAVMSFPLLLRGARVAFEEVDSRLEQMARTLGAHEGRIFWTITLPLALRGVASGAVLAFARALGEFGATILFAGNIPGRTQTLSLSIYQSVQLGQDGRALTLLAISTVIAFVAVWTSEFYLKRHRPAR
jgi:molybdate transport system permease protein